MRGRHMNQPRSREHETKRERREAMRRRHETQPRAKKPITRSGSNTKPNPRAQATKTKMKRKPRAQRGHEHEATRSGADADTKPNPSAQATNTRNEAKFSTSAERPRTRSAALRERRSGTQSKRNARPTNTKTKRERERREIPPKHPSPSTLTQKNNAEKQCQTEWKPERDEKIEHRNEHQQEVDLKHLRSRKNGRHGTGNPDSPAPTAASNTHERGKEPETRQKPSRTPSPQTPNAPPPLSARTNASQDRKHHTPNPGSNATAQNANTNTQYGRTHTQTHKLEVIQSQKRIHEGEEQKKRYAK
mmetsp:Transcript_26832/g.88052  ORF Transcript_26832/g.88052 Transcript_26832/m.88052 type:complete len:304 (-) Transcript_26832:390-1301(-)